MSRIGQAVADDMANEPWKYPDDNEPSWGEN
jgi:hypothetical protein